MAKVEAENRTILGEKEKREAEMSRQKEEQLLREFNIRETKRQEECRRKIAELRAHGQEKRQMSIASATSGEQDGEEVSVMKTETSTPPSVPDDFKKEMGEESVMEEAVEDMAREEKTKPLIVANVYDSLPESAHDEGI
ncbi:uncharacterized protein LOC143986582 [Lithobates pipiens]